MQYNQPSNDPQNFFWYEHGFSKEELDKIYSDIDNVPFHVATVVGSDKAAPKEIRNSKIKWIPKTSKWNWLYTKLIDMSTTANKLWGFDLISADERIQYTEYLADDGGHYTWHQDIGPGKASLRKISITVQLSESDEYEGGDLEISQGGNSVIKANRGAGVVMIFPSYMMHRVTPVTKGKRVSFVLWVGGQHYR